MKRRDFLKHAGLLTLAPIPPRKEGWTPEIPKPVQPGYWFVSNKTDKTLYFSKWPETFQIKPGECALVPSKHQTCHYNYGLEVVWLDS